MARVQFNGALEGLKRLVLAFIFLLLHSKFVPNTSIADVALNTGFQFQDTLGKDIIRIS